MKTTKALSLTLFSALFLLVSASTRADAPRPALDINKDPYVVLYQIRLDMAKVAVDRSMSVAALEKARYDMAQRLYNSAAVSYEEYITRRAAMEVANLQVAELRVKVKEMEGVLEVVKFLRAAGRDVPLFPGSN